MDAFVLLFAMPLIVVAGVFFFMAYMGNRQQKKAKIDYVNSVRAKKGNPNNNHELLEQMTPSDSVVSYLELNYIVGGMNRKGFIAITEERLIFKAVTIGDNTAHLDNAFANNRGASSGVNLRFDIKEETCNVPVSRVTSMSKVTESFELKGCMTKTEVISAYVLRVNAQGLLYNLFLGENGSIVDEFIRTFTSMTRDQRDEKNDTLA